MNKYKDYLMKEVPQLLEELKPNHRRRFGLMSAQHMIEHLIWVTKSSVKEYGDPPSELTEGQLNFMKFIEKGAYLYHRPSDKTKDDLPALRMPNLQQAIDTVPEAIDRLYGYSADHVFFNPSMGRLTFSEMERFHYMHFKFHLQHQFGLGLY